MSTEPLSQALAGVDAVARTRPDFAAAHAHRPTMTLRESTRVALGFPGTPTQRDYLRELDRPPEHVEWTPEATALREAGAAIRRETLVDLEGALTTLTRNAEACGTVVHRARTVDDARRIITEIVRAHDAHLVTKAKSMITEEIGLADHLEGQGIEVVETDLGEYIVQLRDESPSQLITPALHLTKEQVADTFSSFGQTIAPEPVPLAEFARTRLREDFRRADVGITGVNFAAADTGTLCIITSEGNADMIATHPTVMVAVMGMDKVIPRVADLGVLVPLLCHAAAEKHLTAYQTLLTGPRRADEADGPEELHLVIVDNGRTEIAASPMREILCCIRCGNCQMVCPVFRALGGGHAYGAVYGGPVGGVLTPLLTSSTKEQKQLPLLSTLCGSCADACPVKIPLPDLLVLGRERYVGTQTGPTKAVESGLWRAWSAAWSRPRAYLAMVHAAHVVGRLVPRQWLAHVPIARLWADHDRRRVPPIDRAGLWRRYAAPLRREDSR